MNDIIIAHFSPKINIFLMFIKIFLVLFVFLHEKSLLKNGFCNRPFCVLIDSLFGQFPAHFLVCAVHGAEGGVG